MKKIIMDFNNNIVKTALVENSKLIELLIDKFESQTCVGNIYIGVVKKIFSSQFAFIDIGEDKDGFLQLDDKKQENLYKIKNNIKKLNIKVGDKIIVQALKDKLDKKNIVVTSQISFIGHYLILVLNNKDICISQKIKNEDKKCILKSICKNMINNKYGCIVRTEAENVKPSLLEKEFLHLDNLAKNIIKKCNESKDIGIIYKENNIYEKSLKIFLKNDIDNIIINSNKEEKNIKNILKNYNIDENILTIYNKDINIFLEYELEDQIEKALNKKVWLKSGGFLIIEKTEAFNVIDVNTGKCISKNKKNNFIFKTNLEASIEIPKQIRLRNLSGIIIIDFIDMKNKKDRDILVSKFSEELSKDRINIKIVGLTELGLFQITRKKTRQELSNYFLSNCKYCNKNGTVYKENYIIEKIYNKVYKISQKCIFEKITIECNKNIIKLIKNKDIFNDIEYKFKIEIKFKELDKYNLDYYKIKKE